MQLYKISQELQLLNNLEIDDEAAEIALTEQLNALQIAFSDKAEGICSVLRGLEYEAGACREEAARLEARARSLEHKKEWLRKYLRVNMEASGIDKIKTTRFTVSYVTPKPKVVFHGSLCDLPVDFKTTKITETPNKEALLAAYQNGEVLPDGVEIINEGSLRIR